MVTVQRETMAYIYIYIHTMYIPYPKYPPNKLQSGAPPTSSISPPKKPNSCCYKPSLLTRGHHRVVYNIPS